MRPRTVLAAGLMLSGLLAPATQAQGGYQHGRLQHVDPGVTLQRAAEVAAEEADANAPFLPGDRIWTNAYGRVEFQFPEGSIVRLDRRSKLDYAGHDERADERIVLRLWSGSLFLRVRSRHVCFEIETPSGVIEGLERSLVRIDVDGGATRVSVYSGEATLDDGYARVRLAAGERTSVAWGEHADAPWRFDTEEQDDFALWDSEWDFEERRAARSAEYLPDELDAYAYEFEEYGDWRHETTIGYVWVPRVRVGWRPYWNGRWCWTPYGWTWVPYDRWGWAPFHYGRWGYSISFGWYWIPGRTWGPAWVSWAVGGGYVGWCPLGRHNRPIVAWGHGRSRSGDHAVRRSSLRADGDAWNVVRRSDLGRRDVARRRIPSASIATSALQVADSAALHPTHDGRRLRKATAVPRAISRRPNPGGFVRKLSVDSKTTTPPSEVRNSRAASREPSGSAAAGQTSTRRWFTPRATGGSTSSSQASSTAGRRRATDRTTFSPARTQKARPAQQSRERVLERQSRAQRTTPRVRRDTASRAPNGGARVNRARSVPPSPNQVRTARPSGGNSGSVPSRSAARASSSKARSSGRSSGSRAEGRAARRPSRNRQ